MKKFLTICLVISVGFNLYLYNTEYIVRDDFNEDYIAPEKTINDHVHLAQSALMKKRNSDCKNTALIRPKKTKRKSEIQITDEKVKRDEHYSEDMLREKLEAHYSEWIQKSDDFFIEKLALSAEQIAEYRDLSKQRQSEINEYFNKKTKNADDKPSTYMFNSDDTIFMGRVAEKYENLLKETFGEENYKKHKEFIKNHNDTIMTDEFVQVVEF